MTAAISSFTAPPLPQATVQPPAPQQPHHDFAQMLSQRQAQAHEAMHAAPEPQPAEEPASKPQSMAKQAAATPPPGERSAAKTGKAPAAKATEPADREDKASASDKAVSADDAQPAEAVDPALADWLAALNLPAAPVPADAPVATGRSATTAGADLTRDAAEVKGAKGKPGVVALKADAPAAGTARSDTEPADRLDAARDTRDARDARGKPDAVATDTSASSWQAAMERVAPAEVTPRHETPGIAALAAAHGVAAPQRAAEAAAPVAVSMPTPATAPEFAQALGVQVSVLARDGVQTAKLHLNPADMGPISVQIALEGTQAQVNFGADSAATRQIIESGLPELAAALRDAGFTLSGGGVHSQARGRDQADGATGGDGNSRGGASSETEVTARPVKARVSAGGVDLYA